MVKTEAVEAGPKRVSNEREEGQRNVCVSAGKVPFARPGGEILWVGGHTTPTGKARLAHAMHVSRQAASNMSVCFVCL